MSRKIDEKKLSEVSEKHGLTNLQENVVRELLKDPRRTKKAIMIAAGYSAATTDNGQSNALRNTSVRNAVAEYMKSKGISDKINQHYNDVLTLDSTDLQAAKVKQIAINELHKIRGDYAPAKSQSVKISGSISDMFGGSNKDCNPDANIIEGEIEEEEA